ncbi:MAG: UvrD-helicase domain-containing protein [Acidobacteriia bacterium]|nr:UvrD-helicase domain-containing protein [Terriglobia bacterium]
MTPAPHTLPADHQQRQQALDPARSFIVQAPAGSGKTELLIQRYLVLLARAGDPESVLAITFTIKAAAEMRARVLQALRQAASAPEPAAPNDALTWRLARAVVEQDRRLGWSIESNHTRLRIQTIDALCVSITRRMPWLARFGAMPAIVEDAARYYEEAARDTLLLLEGNDRYADAVALVVSHLDNNLASAGRLLKEMLARRDQWLRHIGSGSDREHWREAMEESLAQVTIHCLTRLRETVPPHLTSDLAAYARFAAANLDKNDALQACRELNGLPGASPDDLPAWRGLAQLLLTGKEWRKNVNVRNGFPTSHKREKDGFLALLRGLHGNLPLLQALRELDYTPPPHFEDGQWELMEALLDLLPAAAAQLKTVFQRRGVVDFVELLEATLRAMGSQDAPTDLAFALGHRFEHLLVDEMQDTSVLQVRLIEMLTASWEPGDGRTLFLVGDPMQSIYRFREADVGRFLMIRQTGLPSVRPEPLTLTANFRSRPEVVDWVNQAFQQIFPAFEDAALGAVAYSPCAAFRPESGAAAIQVHAIAQKDGAQDDAALEAILVADLVEQARIPHPAGTTAILVRARPHLPPIVAELKRRGLKFRALDIDPLTSRPIVGDLLALTRALLHPADRIAWLAVLRAPWCGLTIAELHALTPPDPKALLWPNLCGLLPATPALERFCEAMAHALHRVRRASLRECVEQAWIALGGPACLDGEAAFQEAQRFFELLDQLEEGGEIADTARLEKALEELHASPDPLAPETLQIMTIHKAKGLEFDTVIVPGMSRDPGKDPDRLLRWAEVPFEDGSAMLFAPVQSAGEDKDPVYRYLGHLDRNKTAQETVRLLYVAATRARESLHLIGHGGARAGTLMHALWPVVGDQFQGLGRPARGEIQQEARPPRLVHRLPSSWQAPQPPPAVRWQSVEAARSAPSEEVTFAWAGETLRHVGTVVHAYLERMAKDGLDNWSRHEVDLRAGAIRTALFSLGVPASELVGGLIRVTRALQAALEDPRGRWILQRRNDDACELALTAAAGDLIRQARIDRTFTEDGVRWIIDYKSSSHEGGDPDAFLDNEVVRYRAQLSGYAGYFPGERVRLGLYFPLLGAWREVEESQSA